MSSAARRESLVAIESTPADGWTVVERVVALGVLMGSAFKDVLGFFDGCQHGSCNRQLVAAVEHSLCSVVNLRARRAFSPSCSFACADLQVPGPAVNDSVEAPGEVVEVEREGLCNRSTQGGCRGWGKSHVLDGMVDVEVVCQGIDKGDGVSCTRVAK
jgi:hypothetical protein